jgi:arginase family enzyme
MRYLLASRITTSRMGGRCYLHDSQLGREAVLAFPTSAVDAPVHDAVATLRRALPPSAEPLPIERLRALLRSEDERSCLPRLIEAGVLTPAEGPAAPAGVAEGSARPGPLAWAAAGKSAREAVAEFEQFGRRSVVPPRTFFNVPVDVDPAAVDVALAGVPAATRLEGAGAALGPQAYRIMTGGLSWFDIHGDGVYSDVLLAGGALPETLCQGVVIADHGDLVTAGETVDAIFAKVRRFDDEVLAPRGVRPIYVGGDHAITFPTVHALRHRYPRLNVVHLDAHHDLFFSPNIKFNHSTTIRDLVLYTRVDHVFTFGLRSFLFGSPRRVDLARGRREWGDKVSLFSLHSVKELLTDPARLGPIFGARRREPFYLTIDLDVLSDAAMGGQLTTPAGAGLEWWELMRFVDELFRRLDIVGCDVVELNPLRKDRPAFMTEPAALLLLLIDRLARQRRAAAATRRRRDRPRADRPSGGQRRRG